MYKFCLVALLVTVAPSFALANGGGNTKGNGSIEVRNNDPSQVLLTAVAPSSALLSSTTLEQFTSRGGRVVNPGGSTTFRNVKVGNQQVLLVLTSSSATSVPTNPQFRVVSVTRNTTSRVTAP